MTHIMRIDEMVSGASVSRVENIDLFKEMCRIANADNAIIVERIMEGVGATDKSLYKDVYLACPSFVDIYDDSGNNYFYCDRDTGAYVDYSGHRVDLSRLAKCEIETSFGLVDMECEGFFRSIIQTDRQLNGLVFQDEDREYDIMYYFYNELGDKNFSNNVWVPKIEFSGSDGNVIEVTGDYVAELINNASGSVTGAAKANLDVIVKELTEALAEFRDYIIPKIKDKFFKGSL